MFREETSQKHENESVYPRKNGGWGTLAGVIATIELSSRYGSKLAYYTGIWGESYRLFAAKFLFGLCFGFRLVLDVRPANFVDDLGIAFVDD